MPQPNLPHEHADVETKAAARRGFGAVRGAAGVGVGSRSKWDPNKHPRDSKGQFVETGGTARLPASNATGKVVRVAGGRAVIQRSIPKTRVNAKTQRIVRPNQDGTVTIQESFPAKQLTMVKRPNGTSPLKANAKNEAAVMDEDSRRELDPKRGNGLDTDDEGDRDGDGVPDKVDAAPDDPAVTSRKPAARVGGTPAKKGTAGQSPRRFATLKQAEEHLDAGADKPTDDERALLEKPDSTLYQLQIRPGEVGKLTSRQLTPNGSFLVGKDANGGWRTYHVATGRPESDVPRFKTKREALVMGQALEEMQVDGKPFDWDSPGVLARLDTPSARNARREAPFRARDLLKEKQAATAAKKTTPPAAPARPAAAAKPAPVPAAPAAPAVPQNGKAEAEFIWAKLRERHGNDAAAMRKGADQQIARKQQESYAAGNRNLPEAAERHQDVADELRALAEADEKANQPKAPAPAAAAPAAAARPVDAPDPDSPEGREAAARRGLAAENDDQLLDEYLALSERVDGGEATGQDRDRRDAVAGEIARRKQQDDAAPDEPQDAAPKDGPDGPKPVRDLTDDELQAEFRADRDGDDPPAKRARFAEVRDEVQRRKYPDDAGQDGEQESEFSRAEQAKIRNAVADTGAKYSAGGDGDRYVAEGELKDLVDKHGLDKVRAAVRDEMDRNPDALKDRPTEADLRDRKEKRAGVASQAIMDARKAHAEGRRDDALAHIDEAEDAHPTAYNYDDARKLVRGDQQDAPETPTRQESPREQVRPDSADVLGDVPAEADSGAERPGGVFPDAGRAGGGSGRGSGDGRGSSGDGDVQPGNSDQDGRQEDGGGAADGRPGVPAPGAGDGEPAPAEPGPARVGGRRPSTARGAKRAVAKPGRFDPRGQADLQPEGEKAKLAANMAALRTLRKVQSEDRPATAKEQSVLARWAGWGSLPKLFDEKNPEFAAERAELKELLDEREYRAARRNMLNAHYTDAGIVDNVWKALQDLGFNGGDVLEPGSGAGNFIGRAPDGAHMTGVEVEPITADISKLLYPDAEIHRESFARSPFRRDVFDAAIGNVPFGNYALADKEYNPDKADSIHNHFINKAFGTTKPGGVVAMVTSSWTMDADGGYAFRRKMHMQGADLIGAVRLPAGAHQRTAGTQVVTDVLLFRKRKDGEAPGDDSWVKSSPAVHADGKPVLGIARKGEAPGQYKINDYFAKNPDKVLGTLRDGGYNGIGVAANKDRPLEDQMAEKLAEITAAAKAEGRGWAPAADASDMARAKRQAGNDREGRIEFSGTKKVTNAKTGKVTEESVFTQIEDGREQQLKVPSTQVDEVQRLLELRDLADTLLDLESETSDDDDPAIVAARSRLNAAYDAYVAKYNAITRYSLPEDPEAEPIRRRPPAMNVIRKDEGSASIFGLEKKYDPETKQATKADIFTSRQIDRNRQVADHTDDPADAIALAEERGEEPSLENLARILNLTPDQTRQATKGLIFETPEGEHVPRAKYLSDNVREKWNAAREAAAKDPKYQINVDELAARLPKAASIADLPLQLGAPWIKPEIVEEFGRHLMGPSNALKVKFDGRQWSVKTPSSNGYGRSATKERETWGTEYKPFYELLEKVLKQQHHSIQVSHKNEDGSITVDKPASQAATAKAAEIEQEFVDWVWSNSDISTQLSDAYTDRFRSLVPRDYDDAPRRAYPGMTPHITLLDHQNAGVARAVGEESVLFDHVVGSGKTFTLAATAMELKRLGMVDKPVLAVPNQLLEQWVSEIKELYPNAKILAADTEALSKDGRRQFAARATASDWDLVLMTHEAFESIPVDDEWMETYLSREVDRLRDQMESAIEEADTKTQKRIEKAIIKAEEKIREQMERRKDDSGINFKTMGFDYVMADEAHVYKNLPFWTAMQGVASPEGAGRARDMHMKLEYLRDKTKDDPKRKIAAFATGTPISNSLAEMYTMTRFLRPDLLDERGIGGFDQWAATFAKASSKLEVDTAAGGYVERTRLRGFTEALGDGLRLWRTFTDTKTADHLDLPRPKLKGGGRKNHVVAPTEAQLEVLASFKQRVLNMPTGPPKEGNDTHVAVITDGRANAISPRMLSKRGLDGAGLSRDDESLTSPKLEKMADEIADIYARTKDMQFRVDGEKKDSALSDALGALQMVMMDTGTPKKGQWSAYQELKDQLVARGVPANKIEFVQDHPGRDRKAELFERARQGDVAVLFGSTGALGTGTNVQNRLYALHHGDGSWKPSDIEQREGRILRRGNQVPEVEIHAYVTTQTHDQKLWDMTSYKQKGLDAIARGDYEMRGLEFADDVDPLKDFDTLTGAASGDPLDMDLRELGADMTKVENAERAWKRQAANAKSTVQRAQIGAARSRQHVKTLQQALGQRQETAGDKFRIQMLSRYGSNYGGANAPVITSRKDAAPALTEKLREVFEGGRFEREDSNYGLVANLAGFNIIANTRRDKGRKVITLQFIAGQNAYDEPLPLDSVQINDAEYKDSINGLITRLENRPDGIESRIRKFEADAEYQQGEEAAARANMDRPFRQADELASMKARKLMLETILNDAKDTDEGGGKIDKSALRQQYAELAGDAKRKDAADKQRRMDEAAKRDTTAPAKDVEPILTPEERETSEAEGPKPRPAPTRTSARQPATSASDDDQTDADDAETPPADEQTADVTPVQQDARDQYLADPSDENRDQVEAADAAAAQVTPDDVAAVESVVDTELDSPDDAPSGGQPATGTPTGGAAPRPATVRPEGAPKTGPGQRTVMVTLPDGTIAYRTSKSRGYNFAVVIEPAPAEAHAAGLERQAAAADAHAVKMDKAAAAGKIRRRSHGGGDDMNAFDYSMIGTEVKRSRGGGSYDEIYERGDEDGYSHTSAETAERLGLQVHADQSHRLKKHQDQSVVVKVRDLLLARGRERATKDRQRAEEMRAIAQETRDAGVPVGSYSVPRWTSEQGLGLKAASGSEFRWAREDGRPVKVVPVEVLEDRMDEAPGTRGPKAPAADAPAPDVTPDATPDVPDATPEAPTRNITPGAPQDVVPDAAPEPDLAELLDGIPARPDPLDGARLENLDDALAPFVSAFEGADDVTLQGLRDTLNRQIDKASDNAAMDDQRDWRDDPSSDVILARLDWVEKELARRAAPAEPDPAPEQQDAPQPPDAPDAPVELDPAEVAQQLDDIDPTPPAAPDAPANTPAGLPADDQDRLTRFGGYFAPGSRPGKVRAAMPGFDALTDDQRQTLRENGLNAPDGYEWTPDNRLNKVDAPATPEAPADAPAAEVAPAPVRFDTDSIDFSTFPDLDADDIWARAIATDTDGVPASPERLRAVRAGMVAGIQSGSRGNPENTSSDAHLFGRRIKWLDQKLADANSSADVAEEPDRDDDPANVQLPSAAAPTLGDLQPGHVIERDGDQYIVTSEFTIAGTTRLELEPLGDGELSRIDFDPSGDPSGHVRSATAEEMQKLADDLAAEAVAPGTREVSREPIARAGARWQARADLARADQPEQTPEATEPQQQPAPVSRTVDDITADMDRVAADIDAAELDDDLAAAEAGRDRFAELMAEYREARGNTAPAGRGGVFGDGRNETTPQVGEEVRPDGNVQETIEGGTRDLTADEFFKPQDEPDRPAVDPRTPTEGQDGLFDAIRREPDTAPKPTGPQQPAGQLDVEGGLFDGDSPDAPAAPADPVPAAEPVSAKPARKPRPRAGDEMTFHESFGPVSKAQLRAYKKHNVSQSDHDTLVETLGADQHRAIEDAVKDPANQTDGGSFSDYKFARNQPEARPEPMLKPLIRDDGDGAPPPSTPDAPAAPDEPDRPSVPRQMSPAEQAEQTASDLESARERLRQSAKNRTTDPSPANWRRERTRLSNLAESEQLEVVPGGWLVHKNTHGTWDTFDPDGHPANVAGPEYEFRSPEAARAYLEKLQAAGLTSLRDDGASTDDLNRRVKVMVEAHDAATSEHPAPAVPTPDAPAVPDEPARPDVPEQRVPETTAAPELPDTQEPGPLEDGTKITTAGGVLSVRTAFDPKKRVQPFMKANGFRWDGDNKAWVWRNGTPGGQPDMIAKIKAKLRELDTEDGNLPSQVTPDDGGFPPTPQQQAILDAVDTGQDVVARALAGTGKTTTLRMIAQRLAQKYPKKKIVYVAFNKTIQVEAAAKMPRNVEARTADSISFQSMNKAHKDRLREGLRRNDDVARHLGVTESLKGEGFGLTKEDQAKQAIAAIERYSISDADNLGPEHVNVPDGAKPAVLALARKAWVDLVSDDGKLFFSNSHATKMWALTRPDMSKNGPGLDQKDVIFFDEAQDINPVLAKVIKDQHLQTIVVGDSNQSIYAFRGATDQLDTWEAPHDLPLTQSWRFGPAVADAGNRFLQLLGADVRVQGDPGKNSTVKWAIPTKPELGLIGNPDAVLTRTNAGAVGYIMGWQDLDRRVAIAGGKGEMAALVRTAKALQQGDVPRNPHPDLAPYKTWAEVAEAAEDDPKIRTLHGIVEKKGIAALEGMLSLLVNEDQPHDMVVSTAHKAKGREWDRVQIGDDFRGPTVKVDDNGLEVTTMPAPEEMRLAYVAVTRAQKELGAGSLSWVRDYTEENGGDPAVKRADVDAPKVDVDPDQAAAVVPDNPETDAPSVPAVPDAPAGRAPTDTDRNGFVRQPEGPYDRPWEDTEYRLGQLGFSDATNAADMAESDNLPVGYELGTRGIKVTDPGWARYHLDSQRAIAEDNIPRPGESSVDPEGARRARTKEAALRRVLDKISADQERYAAAGDDHDGQGAPDAPTGRDIDADTDVPGDAPAMDAPAPDVDRPEDRDPASDQDESTTTPAEPDAPQATPERDTTPDTSDDQDDDQDVPSTPDTDTDVDGVDSPEGAGIPEMRPEDLPARTNPRGSRDDDRFASRDQDEEDRRKRRKRRRKNRPGGGGLDGLGGPGGPPMIGFPLPDGPTTPTTPTGSGSGGRGPGPDRVTPGGDLGVGNADAGPLTPVGALAAALAAGDDDAVADAVNAIAELPEDPNFRVGPYGRADLDGMDWDRLASLLGELGDDDQENVLAYIDWRDQHGGDLIDVAGQILPEAKDWRPATARELANEVKELNRSALEALLSKNEAEGKVWSIDNPDALLAAIGPRLFNRAMLGRPIPARALYGPNWQKRFDQNDSSTRPKLAEEDTFALFGVTRDEMQGHARRGDEVELVGMVDADRYISDYKADMAAPDTAPALAEVEEVNEAPTVPPAAELARIVQGRADVFATAKPGDWPGVDASQVRRGDLIDLDGVLAEVVDVTPGRDSNGRDGTWVTAGGGTNLHSSFHPEGSQIELNESVGRVVDLRAGGNQVDDRGRRLPEGAPHAVEAGDGGSGFDADQLTDIAASRGPVRITTADGQALTGRLSKSPRGRDTYQVTGLSGAPAQIERGNIAGVSVLAGQLDVRGPGQPAGDVQLGSRVKVRGDRANGVAGVLARREPGGAFAVRDDRGRMHAFPEGTPVSAVTAYRAAGADAAGPADAGHGVWRSNPGGALTATVPGQWQAVILPDRNGNGDGDGVGDGVEWHAAIKDGPRKSGRVGTVREAQDAVRTVIDGQRDMSGGRVLTPPREGGRSDRELAGAPLPEQVGGRNAEWAPTGELNGGDRARVEGIDQAGNPITGAGHVLQVEGVDIDRGDRTEPMLAITMAEQPDGMTGGRSVVLAPINSLSARVPSNGDDVETGEAMDVIQGRLPDIIPADANGYGLFPQTLVTAAGRDGDGIVVEARPADVTVSWGADDESDHGPASLTVADGGLARPAGWTTDGRRINEGQQVSWDGGAGVVESINGDTLLVTQNGKIVYVAAGDVRDVGARKPAGAPDGARPAKVTPVMASDVTPGDTVLLAGEDGTTIPAKVQDVTDSENGARQITAIDTRDGAQLTLDVDRDMPLDSVIDDAGEPASLGEQAPATGRPNLMPNVTFEEVTDATAHPTLPDGLRDTIGGQGYDLDGGLTDPMSAAAAARLRAGEPITAEQAQALAVALRASSEGQIPAGQQRELRRAAARMDAVSAALGTGGTAPVPAAGDAELTGPAGLGRGDMIAIPGGEREEWTVGKVRSITPMSEGAFYQVKVDSDGVVKTRYVDQGEQLWRMPDGPDEERIGEPEQLLLDVPASRPGDDVPTRRADEAASAVAAAAAEAAMGASSLNEMRELVARALTKEATAGIRADVHRSSRRAGSEGPEVREATDRAVDQVRDAALRTINEVEPLAGEAEADTIARVAQMLLDAGRAVRSDRRANRRGPSAGRRNPGNAPASDADRDLQDAKAGRIDGLLGEVERLLSGAGVLDGTMTAGQQEALLQSISQRMAGRHQRALRAAAPRMAGRPGQATAMGAAFAGIRDLIVKALRALFAAGQWTIQAVRALFKRLAQEARGWKENRRLRRLMDGVDVGGSNGSADLVPGEPSDVAGRMRFWNGRMPKPGQFGQKQVRGRWWTPSRSGGAPAAADGTRWVPDVAADGGPGPDALAHLDSLRGLGRTVSDDVQARIAAAVPDLGDDPKGAVQARRRSADDAARAWRDADAAGDPSAPDLETAAFEAGRDADLAERSYALAQQQAVRESIANTRDVGEGEGITLNVIGDGPEADAMRWAAQFLPRDWIASAGDAPLTVEQAERGSYGGGHASVADLGEDVDGAGPFGKSALHELMHHMQEQMPDLTMAEWSYLWARTSRGDIGARQRDPLQMLRELHELRGHGPDETTREDDFPDSYMGRHYEGREHDVTEIGPMALESLFGGAWYLDDGLMEFALGMLAWIGRRDG